MRLKDEASLGTRIGLAESYHQCVHYENVPLLRRFATNTVPSVGV